MYVCGVEITEKNIKISLFYRPECISLEHRVCGVTQLVRGDVIAARPSFRYAFETWRPPIVNAYTLVPYITKVVQPMTTSVVLPLETTMLFMVRMEGIWGNFLIFVTSQMARRNSNNNDTHQPPSVYATTKHIFTQKSIHISNMVKYWDIKSPP